MTRSINTAENLTVSCDKDSLWFFFVGRCAFFLSLFVIRNKSEMMMKRKDPLSLCFVFYIDRLFMDWLLDLCEISSIYHNIFIKKYTGARRQTQTMKARESEREWDRVDRVWKLRQKTKPV